MTMRVWGLAAACVVAVCVQASAEDGQPQYQKTTADQLLVKSVTTNRDGSPLVGQRFDVVGVLSAMPGYKHTAAFEGTGAVHDGTGQPTRIAVELVDLPDEVREQIRDQCAPTPCRARLLVTVGGPAKDGFVFLHADGFR